MQVGKTAIIRGEVEWPTRAVCLSVSCLKCFVDASEQALVRSIKILGVDVNVDQGAEGRFRPNRQRP